MKIKTGIATAGAAFAALGLMASVAVADAPPAAKKGYTKAATAADDSYHRPYIGNWSGLYVGGSVGMSWSSVDQEFDVPGLITVPYSTEFSGLAAGGQVGLQHQWGNTVAGVEVSFTSTDLNDNRGPLSPLFNANTVHETRLKYVGATTLKLGYAADQWMAYVKGGFAFGRGTQRTYVNSPGGETVSFNNELNGFTIGVGLDYKILPNVTLGVGYDYYSLDGDKSSISSFGNTFRDKFDADTHVVSARLNVFLLRPSASAGEAMK